MDIRHKTIIASETRSGCRSLVFVVLNILIQQLGNMLGSGKT